MRTSNVLARTDYDFSSLSASTSTGPIQLCHNLASVGAGRGVLRLRIHAANLPAGASFRVDGRAVAPTQQDPTLYFRGRVVTTVVATSTTVSPPQVLECPLADGFGGCLALFLTVKQGGIASTLTFTISAELELDDRVSGWSPLALGSKLRLWVDEHDLIAMSGAYSDWGDQSAAGNDFTQGTASLRPATGAEINQYAAPDFDGNDDYLASNTLASFVQASAYHVFAVFRPDKINGVNGTSYLNDAVISDTGAGWWGLYLKNDAGTPKVLGFHWGSGQHVATAVGVDTATDTLVEWSYDGSTIRVQVGGEAVATAAATGIGYLGEVVRIASGPAGGIYLDGRTAAFIVCNQYLSEPERLSIRGYLAAKYGLPS